MTAADLGDLGIVLGLSGMGLAGGAFVGALYRYRRNYDILVTAESLITGGLILALMFLGTLVIGAGAITYLLAQWTLH